jgi:hypothetical protein
MAPARTVVLNGNTYYPTEVEELAKRIGVVLTADDGTPTIVSKGTKRGWVLRWSSPLPYVADLVRGLYVTVSFSFTDPYGATYNVVVPPDGLRHTIVHLPGSAVAGTAGGTTEPGLELTILEG